MKKLCGIRRKWIFGGEIMEKKLKFSGSFMKKVWEVIKIMGCWFPVLLFIGYVCLSALQNGEWGNLKYTTTNAVIALGILGMGIILFGNLFLLFLYGSKPIKLFSFCEGIQKWKQWSMNDIRNIFPYAKSEIIAKNKSSNIVFGRWNGREIGKAVNIQNGHVNCIGTTGSGKTTKCIIPTMLNLMEQQGKNGEGATFLAIDIKGELESIANKVSKKSCTPYKYKVFNPEKSDSFGFNPYFLMKEMESNDEKVEIIEEIVYILIPIVKEEKGNKFWLDGARSYLTGALWFYFQYEHLEFIDSIKRIGKEDPFAFIEQVKYWGDKYIDIYYSDMYGYAEKREKTISYFFSEVKRNIQLFAVNTAISEAFSKKDENCITPIDLLSGQNIFMQISEKKMPIYGKACAIIIDLFVKCFVGINESTTKIPNTVWLLDEFAQLPYMPSMDSCISTIRSKGVTLVFCLQEPEAQIKEKYGEAAARIFMQNCTYNIIYGTGGETAEYFSREIGEYYKKTKSYSEGKERTISVSEKRERILPAQELRYLSKNGKAVLLCPFGYYYINVKPWYRNKKWN